MLHREQTAIPLATQFLPYVYGFFGPCVASRRLSPRSVHGPNLAGMPEGEDNRVVDNGPTMNTRAKPRGQGLVRGNEKELNYVNT